MLESNVAPLRWGILATGNIARTFAKAVPSSQNGILQAVASRSAESAAKFAKEVGVPTSYGSYDELLANKSERLKQYFAKASTKCASEFMAQLTATSVAN